MDGYNGKFKGIDVVETTVDEYKKNKYQYDRADHIWIITDHSKVVFKGQVYAFYSKLTNEFLYYLNPYSVNEYIREADNNSRINRAHRPDSYNLDQAIAENEKRLKEEKEATQWLEAEIAKLSPADYKCTFYAIARICYLPIGKRVIKDYRDIVVPVDVYENFDGIGFEVIRVVSLAGQVPWDLKDTIVKLDTENTHINGRVEDLVTESLPIHQKLAWLDEHKKE